MNKEALQRLKVVPDGQEAWLSYDNYLELKHLFEAAPLTRPEQPSNSSYRRLHRFLTTVAGLDLPLDEQAIHFNAFVLIRRGYQVETITPQEYDDLVRLLDGLAEPAGDDMDLYETGGHRALYEYLTRQMGLSVPAGRGPAWHRAQDLVKKYEAEPG